MLLIDILLLTLILSILIIPISMFMFTNMSSIKLTKEYNNTIQIVNNKIVDNTLETTTSTMSAYSIYTTTVGGNEFDIVIKK